MLPKKCCRSRDGSYAYVCSKGGSWVNTTRCRTHGLKSGACRRPETERQSPSSRLSHDSRVAFREFVTHSGTARPPQFDYRDPRGSLHAPRHSVASSIRGSNRPESPRRAYPTTLLRDIYLATEYCRRRQQSTTSIFNLRSHIWGGWLGARIYNLHSPSPISTFWPVLLLSDLQSTISIFDL